MKIVSLVFNFQLHPSNIRGFRAAIVEVLGLGHHLFHGHDNSEPGVVKYTNAYPLIRFCTHRGRACVIGMGAGADAINRHLVPVIPSNLHIRGRSYDTSEFEVRHQCWRPEVTNEFKTFYLHQWIALNQKNYNRWKVMEGDDMIRGVLLDKAVTGHLRALAEATDLSIDQTKIVGRVMRQDRIKKIRWHGNAFVSFDVQVVANFIPFLGLGLGRCHSFGFGEACSQRTYEILNQMTEKQSSTEAVRPTDSFMVESILDLL